MSSTKLNQELSGISYKFKSILTNNTFSRILFSLSVHWLYWHKLMYTLCISMNNVATNNHMSLSILLHCIKGSRNYQHFCGKYNYCNYYVFQFLRKSPFIKLQSPIDSASAESVFTSEFVSRDTLTIFSSVNPMILLPMHHGSVNTWKGRTLEGDDTVS